MKVVRAVLIGTGATAAPVSHERELGLATHYSIGVGLAGLLVTMRPGWTERPTIGPALATGLGSTLAPSPAFARVNHRR